MAEISAFFLTEATAFAFLRACLKGERPILLAVEPILPPLGPLLRRLARWAEAGDRLRPAVEVAPELAPLMDYPTRVLLHDMFGRLEPWHDRHYRYAEFDRACPAHAFAYRQISCNHVRWKHHALLLIQALRRACPGMAVQGASPDTAAMAAALGETGINPTRPPAPVFNLAISLIATAFALGWIASRLRPRVAAASVFLAADYIADERDHALFDEVAEGGPLLMVPREPSRVVPPDLAARSTVASPGAGRFTPAGALAMAAEVLGEAVALFRHFHRLEPAHFWAMAALPWRRAVLRAFFTRYRPRFFWGRDDYNVEHILRRQELHRVGGVSLGIIHGYPAYALLFPMWRYVSFDRYYIFGRALYDRYMKASWAPDMEVRAVGSFGASRRVFRERFVERPADILVFTAVLVGDPGMVAFVRGLAEAFPERRVLLQIKGTFIETATGRDFAADCTRGLANVEPVRDGMFDLFRRGRYCFSDPSTLVVEALQFGLYAFNVDICAVQRVSLLREYPDICVRSVEEAVARIRGIEDASRPYGRAQFADLVDLSGQAIHDVIRQDMGLAPREAAVPLSDMA